MVEPKLTNVQTATIESGQPVGVISRVSLANVYANDVLTDVGRWATERSIGDK